MRHLLLATLGLALVSAPVMAEPNWPVAAPETQDVSAEGLAAMDAAVRAGTFQKITSVLIARHGRLVHEVYFDEADRESRRNTRSVTKTVTAMLVGAALGRGDIASVDAPVMPFVADHAPSTIPIRARPPSRSRTC
ncbi:serine hydrolase [Brevundimonas intermedia]|uniref:serine hydrolase n=1 Tax=Brevundimonas intermedia TaxID=74315 RepID=UPI00247337AD|nr:serine hydrolase [Brevundimonas intermedia]